MRRRLVLAVLFACGSPPPAAPGAVVNATPRSFCANQETVIDLDSSGTSSHLTLVAVAPSLADTTEFPLAVEWSLPGNWPSSCAKTAARPCIEGDPTVDHTHDSLGPFRMFGYDSSTNPIVSTRVVNETAVVLDYLNKYVMK